VRGRRRRRHRPTRDFNYVGDTVAAFAAIRVSHRVYCGRPCDAGSGVAVSVAEMCEYVRALTGVNKPVLTEAARMRPERAGVMTLLADSERLTAAKSWTTSVDFESVLDHTIEWWRGRIARGDVR